MAKAEASLSASLGLQWPLETRDWLILREGYLSKSKLAKGLIRSTKLRWFVLKQDPVSRESRLEYYEGRLFRGSCTLRDAVICPAKKPGTFSIQTPRAQGSRTITLATDANQVDQATQWVLALKRAATSSRDAAAAAANGDTQSLASQGSGNSQRVLQQRLSLDLNALMADVTVENTRSRGGDGEIDGAAIDNARWAALRKTGQPEEEAQDFEEDEDVRLLREMEEEEERRQEEERLAFLAEREAQKQAQKQAAAELEKEAAEESTPAADPEPEVAEGDVSEDEDDFFAEMERAEREEAERQEREHQEWLKSQAAQ
ncbi:uncharacterized protein MONBRDRAFT_36460 [Monosiga brevicollis MX1]|uniref:PH domain-containing protein n=1 Tax=Monosiga brevicollis TaxID=81824 RepID=A9UUN1_MONBE|nr:uncharacterized protein MONBRDRAFT_36460 [Monosiga brevicollis MX1]EDQ91127.1 predicted protein [Monosiga brevicollis MX1]|eukprot:XP_001744424.1 hypothetical protein [Monosiga brevicollis MX1]